MRGIKGRNTKAGGDIITLILCQNRPVNHLPQFFCKLIAITQIDALKQNDEFFAAKPHSFVLVEDGARGDDLDEQRCGEKKRRQEYKAKALIYGARKIPPYIIDFIENNGIDIEEDDTCRGRRLFDISLNAESEYLFYELLDAYSYRPMSPCIRTAGERYELLYKLLRNYGINLLIFYKDDLCGITSEAVNYLRIRCMRDGIDPLVIDRKNYKETVENYTGRL